MKAIWIRADDVGQAPDQFRYFHEELSKHGIPVTYAAIPGLLSAKDAAWLRGLQEEGNAVVQHGFMHADHSGQPRPRYKYEFGANRTREEQERDVHQGIRLMDMHFGDAWTRVFVPPWHGFDTTTLDILRARQYDALSTSLYEESLARQGGLTWLPVHAMVDLDATIKQSAEQVMHALMTRERVGVLFHPADLATPEADTRLRTMLEFLKRAAERTGARFGTVREVVARAAPAC